MRLRWFFILLLPILLTVSIPCPATIRCSSVSQTVTDSAAGVDLIADFPLNSVQVNEEFFVKAPTLPGQPPQRWFKCKFGTTCHGVVLGTPYSRKDSGDGVITWQEHVGKVCAGADLSAPV
jgi:hypothetical protein